MGREDRTDLGQLVVDIKGTQTAHPLIGVVDGFSILIPLSTLHTPLIETLDDQGCSIREHRRLVIVAIGMQRVHLIVLPQPAVYFVLMLEERIKVYENGNRLSRYRPTAYPHLQTLLLGHTLPFRKKTLIFLEIRTLTLFPEIRTNEDDLILKYLL